MASPAAKAHKGIGMEGFIARWYAANTRKSMNDFHTLARRIAGLIPTGSHVLEVAPGPGYFAIKLAKLGDYQVTGIDISKTFVEIARANARASQVNVEFLQGNASSMPFSNETFNFLLCRAAFKNFSEPLRAIQEMHRVLKPRGKALIIDLRRDASRKSIDQFVDGMGMSALSRAFTKMTFRFMLLKRAYNKDDFLAFLAQAEFRGVDIEESATGLEIWLEK